MFKELVPILRNRAVLMTATALDDDQIRVNVVPKKMKDGDHDALTTPLSVTGTAEELDAQLGSTLVGFVASHLQMKNSLEKAKADSRAARRVIAESLFRHNNGTVYWLDLGNNAASGQFVLGQPLNYSNRRSAQRLRTVALNNARSPLRLRKPIAAKTSLTHGLCRT
jgi:PRTRC genetic system protein E